MSKQNCPFCGGIVSLTDAPPLIEPKVQTVLTCQCETVGCIAETGNTNIYWDIWGDTFVTYKDDSIGEQLKRRLIHPWNRCYSPINSPVWWSEASLNGKIPEYKVYDLSVGKYRLEIRRLIQGSYPDTYFRLEVKLRKVKGVVKSNSRIVRSIQIFEWTVPFKIKFKII